jgi:prevent-host-death family protein
MYTSAMAKAPHSPHEGHVEVGIREFRDHLSRFVEAVQSGRDVVITDRGRPVARLIGVDEYPPGLQRLISKGLAEPPTMPKEPARARPPVKAKGSVSDLVAEQRR